MQIEALRAVSKITDHQEIVKQYQKVVRPYNNSMQDYLWESRGNLMQYNSWFGDMLKVSRKVNLNMNWVDLWVSMQYPYPWATST